LLSRARLRMECAFAERGACAAGGVKVCVDQGAESVVEWAGRSGRGARGGGAGGIVCKA